jgi:hypothetical protein
VCLFFSSVSIPVPNYHCPVSLLSSILAVFCSPCLTLSLPSLSPCPSPIMSLQGSRNRTPPLLPPAAPSPIPVPEPEAFQGTLLIIKC